MQAQPMYEPLNAAVLEIVNILMPQGFDTTDIRENCDTHEKIQEYWDETGKILVWSGGSDCTVFGEPHMNHAFRAWHDYIHITRGLAFNKAGERLAYNWHCVQLDLYLSHKFSRQHRENIKQLLDIEINGQVEYLERFGHFPEYPRTFAAERMQLMKLKL